VVQVTVADVDVMPLVATEEMTGGGFADVLQVSTVIEYGGNERPVAPLKLASVEEVIFTTFELSFVSVGLADVNCCICTVPVGAFVPLKVTGSVALRDRLNITVDRLVPLLKAKD
jgi:hypothetical protein